MQAGLLQGLGLDLPPLSWQGILLVLFAVAFRVQVFLAIDRQSHPVSETLYGVFPYVVPALILLYWAASKTSDAEGPSGQRLPTSSWPGRSAR
jgi:hypothetical protein